jgi:hypothetical protein
MDEDKAWEKCLHWNWGGRAGVGVMQTEEAVDPRTTPKILNSPQQHAKRRRRGAKWRDRYALNMGDKAPVGGGGPGKEEAEDGTKLAQPSAWGTPPRVSPSTPMPPTEEEVGRKSPRGCDPGRPPTETKP